MLINYKILGLIIVHILTNAIAQAEETDQKQNTDRKFIEVKMGIEWLNQNTNRIYSLVTEVDILDEQTGIITTVKSEFVSPNSSEECEKYDVENKYSNYFYYLHKEDIKKQDATYSSWFEGRKMDGMIIKKVISFCFAN